MKIKEKFENIILDNNDLIPAVNQCEEVADNLAINFGNWLDNNQYDRLIDGRWISTIIDFNKSLTTEELLEKFKSSYENKM